MNATSPSNNLQSSPDAALFKDISTDAPFQLQTSGKCLTPITGPLEWGEIDNIGFDVVGGSCETRRKYTWWALPDEPYDNVWHTPHALNKKRQEKIWKASPSS